MIAIGSLWGSVLNSDPAFRLNIKTLLNLLVA
jgi:hypothetical protein